MASRPCTAGGSTGCFAEEEARRFRPTALLGRCGRDSCCRAAGQAGAGHSSLQKQVLGASCSGEVRPRGWKHQQGFGEPSFRVWSWESRASSEASSSLKTWNVQEVQRKSVGQLRVLDAW